ncbi:MAG: PCRF domain-containing protein, partial [Tidjanibacter sp.]|nr:PCRF domain-containing protein [Tidjanibacter sp.]
MITIEQIKELVERRDALHRYLAVEDKRIAHEEEQLKTTAPDFWDNPTSAEKQLKKVTSIKSWIDAYDALSALVDDLEVVAEFVREGGATEAELDAQYAHTLSATEELEMRNMLRGEEDKLGAIVDINSGAGGTESLDWASMLMRMYTRWGERNGFKVRVADFQA